MRVRVENLNRTILQFFIIIRPGVLFSEICMTLKTVVQNNYSKLDSIISKIKLLLHCYIETNFLKMSVVPQGMFAARKVRQNQDKMKNYDGTCDLTPTKYSSKYMNSVWGMYNRYSVHNFKKNIDVGVFTFNTQQLEIVESKQSADKNSADFKGSFSTTNSFLPSPGIL